MRYLLLLPLLSFSAYAQQITQKEFVQVLKNNLTTLNHLETGMSAKQVTRFTSYINGITCDMETTVSKNIIAKFQTQHYVHIEDNTKSLSNNSECSMFEYNEKHVDLKNNDILNFKGLTFDASTVFTKIDDKTYLIQSQFPQGTHMAKTTAMLDVSLSAFYMPISYEVSYNWGFVRTDTSVEPQSDPRSFDLSNISLCFYRQVSDDDFEYTCMENMDLSDLVNNTNK